MLKFQLRTNRRPIKSLAAISSVLLSFVMLIFSAPVFADNDDYLHQLWQHEDESRRNQEAFDKGMGWSKSGSKSASSSLNFCAIAFSKSTHTWGSAWGKGTRAAAEREALSTCSARDAEIVCRSNGKGYCALADGPGSGGENGETAAIAEAKALKTAGSPKSRIIVLVGGSPPRQWYLKDINTWVESTREGDIASGPPPGISDGTSLRTSNQISPADNPLLTMPHPPARH